MPTENSGSISLEPEIQNEKVILRLKTQVGNYPKSVASAVGKIIYDELKVITGKTWFTPRDLRKRGFPYSKGFPIGYAGIDDRIISAQSKKLTKSIRRTTIVTPSGAQAIVWVGDPKAKYLITGTEKMRKRDFFSLALERTRTRVNKIENQFLDDVVKGITRNG